MPSFLRKGLLSFALVCFAAQAFAASGIENRTAILSGATSALDSIKSQWDTQSQLLNTQITNLTTQWSALSASGGWTETDLEALGTITSEANAFAFFKARLLEKFADIKSKISSQRSSAIVVLETLKDEITLAYSSLTDAQKNAYQLRIDTASKQSSDTLSLVSTEITSLSGTYGDILSSAFSRAKIAAQTQKENLATAKIAAEAYAQIQDGLVKLKAKLATFTAAQRDTAQTSFIALSSVKEEVLARVRSLLKSQIDTFLKSQPRLASVQGEIDARLAWQMVDVSDKLSTLFSGSDKWFYAFSKAQTLVDSASGTIARGYLTNGMFRWNDFTNSGSLVDVRYLRDTILSANDTLTNLSGSVSSGSIDANILNSFYVSEGEKATSLLKTWLSDRLTKLIAEDARIEKLVGMHETSLQNDLKNLSDFNLRRVRLKKFAQDAKTEVTGNTEWSVKIDTRLATLQAQQSSDEFAILKTRLLAVTKLESQINAALQGVVKQAIITGDAQAVIEKFKSAREKIPALLEKRISDTNRYALHYIVKKINELLEKIEK